MLVLDDLQSKFAEQTFEVGTTLISPNIRVNTKYTLFQISKSLFYNGTLTLFFFKYPEPEPTDKIRNLFCLLSDISEADLIYTETLMQKGKESYEGKEIVILGKYLFHKAYSSLPNFNMKRSHIILVEHFLHAISYVRLLKAFGTMTLNN